MAASVLVITVGGTCAPVVRAIREHAPSFVCFICSGGKKSTRRLIDGRGAVCEDRPSIVAQTGLAADAYATFEIGDPDELEACYGAVLRALQTAVERSPDGSIVADYTGGTKTMSAALVVAASGPFADRLQLFLVTGDRDGLRMVVDGTESAWRQDASFIAQEDRWQAALRLVNGYHYASAEEILGAIKRTAGRGSSLARKTEELSAICRGFDAWDCFDHQAAFHFLQPHTGLIGAPLIINLRELAKASGGRTGATDGGWAVRSVLPIYDLLFNAGRRAAQGRYDDAVARLYRAIELLAQNRLWAVHHINTSNVDPGKVATWLAAQPHLSSETPLRAGLRDAYGILESLDDPVGRVFAQDKKTVLTMLERRNQSILAHGARPVEAAEYPSLEAPARALVDRAVADTGLRMQPFVQFPQLTAERFGA
jgi:CRISPR-associated protein (TIGR02710 family)